MSDEMFDDSIRRKLNQHESLVPADAWDNIHPKKRKRRAALLWWLLPALLIGGGVYWQNGDHSSSQPKQVALADTATIKGLQATDPSSNTVITKESNDEQTQSTNDALMNSTEKMQTSAGEKSDQKISVSPASGQNNKASISNSVDPSKKDKFNQQASVTIVDVDNTTDVLPVVERDAIAGMVEAPASQDDKAGNEIDRHGINVVLPTASGKINNVQANEKQNAATENAMTSVENVSTDNNKITSMADAVEGAIAPAETSVQSPVQPIKLPVRKLWLNTMVTGISVLPQQENITALNRRTVTGNEFKDFNATTIDVSYEPSISYAMSLQKELNRKWSVGAGFQYQILKQKLFLEGEETQSTINFIDVLVNTGGQNMLVGDSAISSIIGTRTIRAMNSYRRLGLPVFLQYKMLQWPAWYVGLQTGVVINIAQQYNNSISGDFTKQSMNNQNYTVNWGIDLFVQAKLARRLGQRWEAFVAPSFLLNRSAPRQQNWIQTYLNQAGLSTGLSYSLKK